MVGQDSSSDGSGKLAVLTRKQREVLDLLLDHKTSKEIAQALDISHHTVDQRIQIARRKLGAQSRSEVALRYRELKQIYGQTVYDDSDIDVSGDERHNQIGSETDASPFFGSTNQRTELLVETKNADRRIVPELFDGEHRIWFRLGAVMLLVVLIAFAVMSGLAIFVAMSDVLSQ